MKLQPPLPDAGGLHAAPDVHTHQIGHNLVADGHGGADGTALAGVNVGHEPDAAARRKFLIAQLLNLCDGDRKSTRLNSSHSRASRMPSSA